MQQCLNEDATYFYNKFKKYPCLLVLVILFIAIGVALFTVSLLCNYRFPCTDIQQNYTLIFGLNICILVTTFIGIPFILRLILNCIWQKEEVLPVVTRTPLSSRPPSRPRSRSNSREKIPPSPKLRPIPTHASKSFKEYHSEV